MKEVPVNDFAEKEVQSIEELIASISADQDRIISLSEENRAVKEEIEKWNRVYKIFDFVPAVNDYLTEYNIK